MYLVSMQKVPYNNLVVAVIKRIQPMPDVVEYAIAAVLRNILIKK
jgi:uncharacterized membrane protein (DUF373 family)